MILQYTFGPLKEGKVQGKVRDLDIKGVGGVAGQENSSQFNFFISCKS